MVGDSQILRLGYDKMLSKHHEVVLSAKSGMRVEEAANHEDPDANVIIMHADTNNLQESTSEVVTEKVLKTLKNMKKNPNVQFQFPLFSEEKLMLPQMVKLSKPIRFYKKNLRYRLH